MTAQLRATRYGMLEVREIERMHYYYGPMMDDGWGGALLMIILWLLIFAVTTIVAIRLLRDRESETLSKLALDIAKERYTKGEVTKEQFKQLKKDLA